MMADDDEIKDGEVSEDALLEVNEAEDEEEAEDDIEGNGLNAFGDPIDE